MLFTTKIHKTGHKVKSQKNNLRISPAILFNDE